MEATCQCGAVSFTTPTPQPSTVYYCHCSFCRKQSGSAFSTSGVFPPFTLPLDTQPIGDWVRTSSAGKTMHCYFCKICGTRLAQQVEGSPFIAVKGGCLEGLEWKGATHICCGEMVTDMGIPEGAEAYVGLPGSEKFEFEKNG